MREEFNTGIVFQTNQPKDSDCYMINYLFILIFVSSSFACVAQKTSEEQKIAKFKNNYLRRVKLDKTDTLWLDSVTIVRQKKEDFRLIKTIYKNKDLIVEEEYYHKTTQVRSISECNGEGRPKGIAKYFTPAGVLEYMIDNDKGEWIVYDRSNYPFYDLQLAMKEIADSLISAMYGPYFLINHVTWLPAASFISGTNEYQRWTSKQTGSLTKFQFCYKVRLDSQRKYESYIYFDLDDTGNFLPSSSGRGFFFDGYGFENVPKNKKGGFRINPDEALSKARALGLVETDSSKAFASLHWENFRGKDIFNGQFRFYVSITTEVIKTTDPKDKEPNYHRTDKFDVYVFDPWTGDFSELKKMKSIQSLYKGRTRFSLMQSDKE
jgi:hypothetical protein